MSNLVIAFCRASRSRSKKVQDVGFVLRDDCSLQDVPKKFAATEKQDLLQDQIQDRLRPGSRLLLCLYLGPIL